MNYTFATLLSSTSYIPGVLVLYRSLRKYGNTKYPFLCVCSHNISKDDINLLEEEGISCRILSRSAIEGIDIPNTDSDYSHWNYTFDKLLLWSLVEFDKIVFLDSDMIVLDSIDDLFEKKGFSAVPAGYLQNNSWIKLNSGLLVIEPNHDICQQLLRQLPITITQLTNKGKSVGDQDVINDILPDWPEKKELHLSEGYNLFFKHLTSYHQLFNFEYRKNIKIVHFIGNKKPWHDTGLAFYIQFIRYAIKNPYGLKSYRTYHQLQK